MMGAVMMGKCKGDVTESSASHENEKLEQEWKNNFHNVEWQLMNYRSLDFELLNTISLSLF